MKFNRYKFKELANFKYGSIKDTKGVGKYPIYSGYQITGYSDDVNVENEKLLVVCRGVGGTGDVKLSPKKCWVTNLSIICDIDEGKANYKYLYYYLTHENDRMRKLDTGSCQAQITIDQLGLFELLLPSLDVQNKIVNILSNIDMQIERNNAMVQKLQVMGNTIYSKEINKDTKYFDLKTVANISTGKEDANFASPNGKYNFYTCSEEISKCNKYAFDGNSILIAGNGNFNVKYYNGKFNAYQRTYVIQNDTLFGNIYYSSLKSIDGFTKNANGSIIKFITLGLVQDIQIPIFTDKVNIILNNIVSKRNNIILETERLIALKEKLLPLLINGQLNI